MQVFAMRVQGSMDALGSVDGICGGACDKLNGHIS